MLKAPLIVRQMLNASVDGSAVKLGRELDRRSINRYAIIEWTHRYVKVRTPNNEVHRINLTDKDDTSTFTPIPNYLFMPMNRLIRKYIDLGCSEMDTTYTIEYAMFEKAKRVLR